MPQSKLLASVPNLVHEFAIKDIDVESQKIHPYIPHQVHGNDVIFIKHQRGNIIADGLVTDERKVPVGIYTADCIPILIIEPSRQLVAAVHAGWRGVMKNIAKNAIEQITLLGGSAENILVGVGPAIKSCCYSVSQERAVQFRKTYGDDGVMIKSGNYYIDLQTILYGQLISGGIKDAQIDIIAECTYCNDQYYSYRRGDKNKRMVSYLYLK